jgi:uncharacterized protein (DUF1499 family)
MGDSGSSTVSSYWDMVGKDMIEPCKPKPNCVSSLNHEKRYYVAPLQYNSFETAKDKLLDTLKSSKRVRIVANHGNYIRAEFTSFIFRFIDDAEFYFDDKKKLIHLRSASRIGYSDLGANRRRIEKIRRKFLKEG